MTVVTFWRFSEDAARAWDLDLYSQKELGHHTGGLSLLYGRMPLSHAQERSKRGVQEPTKTIRDGDHDLEVFAGSDVRRAFTSVCAQLD